MEEMFGADLYGRKNILSHPSICDACRKPAVLSSYTTIRFLHLRRFPLIPLGKIYIYNECSSCGHRGITTSRKYRKLRTKELNEMMDGFASHPDSPDTTLNGLHTLKAYNEEVWFLSLKREYERRFEEHMQVQLLIAEGLFHFGHYAEAETYCRKAIVLNAGPKAEELLARCQSLHGIGDLALKAAPDLQPESMLRPYAFLLTVTAGLLITLLAAGISVSRNYTVWLVNGTPVNYAVEIDGNRQWLKQYEEKQIILRLGKHRMQIQGLGGDITPISFDYKTSMLRQKILDQTLVLNPDGIAVLVEETWRQGQATNRYLFGEVVHELRGIDFPFSDFPAWADPKHSAQTRLFNQVPTHPQEMVEFVRTHCGSVEAAEYARRILMIDPSLAETADLLKVAIGELDIDRAAAFLQHGRTLLPPLLAWHCFYQDFMAVKRPQHDLQTEYALLWSDHPDVPEFYYLLGRVARSQKIAKTFFEQSETDSGCGGRGYHAIAFDLLCSGNFREAQAYSRQALDKSPGNPEFLELQKQIYLALRQYDLPLQRIRNELESDPENGEWVAEEIKYLTLLGEHKAAAEVINNFSGGGINWVPYFHAAQFYVSGNVSGYLENLTLSGMGNTGLAELLHAGQVDAAHALLSSDEAHEYTDHLLIYCAAKYHGRPEIAEIEMAKAVDEVSTSIQVQGTITALLAGETPPPMDRLLELRIMPAEKAILCASLGFKYPDQQASLFDLSRQLNYCLEDPQILIKKWTRNSTADR